MKRSLRSVVLLASLLMPFAVSAASLTPQYNAATHTLQRPSRRTLRNSVQEGLSRLSRLPSINEVPLDRTYVSSDYHVKIQYPSSWEREDPMQSTPPLTLVVMFLSRNDRSAAVRQNINLVVEDLPTEMTLAEYTKLGIEMEQKFFGQFVLRQSSDIVLAGGAYRAHRIIFSASLNGGDVMTFEQIWMLKGRTAHVWTFADKAEVFEDHVRTFERMMDTLTVQ